MRVYPCVDLTCVVANIRAVEFWNDVGIATSAGGPVVFKVTVSCQESQDFMVVEEPFDSYYIFNELPLAGQLYGQMFLCVHQTMSGSDSSFGPIFTGSTGFYGCTHTA